MRSNTQEAFFALVRGGLWEKDLQLSQFGKVDYDEVMLLAEEQSVVGLVTAGLEHVVDTKVPHDKLIPFIGRTLQIEQRNKAMNEFIAKLVEKMRKAGIYALLAKGQSVAQCYEKPLWRSCGDVDFFLSDENYRKAKAFLIPKASSVDQEKGTHLGMTIDGWVVELHGDLHCRISSRIDKVMDKILEDCFYKGNVRSWLNGNTQVFLMAVENDVLFAFNHFLKHFYKEGLGLRQICDWCRLLWNYREKLDLHLLESRLKQMGLVTEWKAFGTLAVDWLGMPPEAMPMFEESHRWSKKANRIIDFIMMSGNMGHNRDMSHFSKYPYLIRKCVSMSRRIGDLINHASIFPLATLKFTPTIMFNGIVSAIRGE